MPNTPRILTALAAVETALKNMGKETGYHRNYRGVLRTRIGWSEEPDDGTRWVQLAPRATPTKDSNFGDEFLAPAYFRHSLVVEVCVNVSPETMADGQPDILTPWAEIAADIHAALFADRSLGIAQGCVLWYIGQEPAWVFTSEGAILGLTVCELYRIEWDHVGGDMSATA